MIIDRADCQIPNDARRIPWISSYQGETDYEVRFGHLNGRRITFRWGKLPWRWSWLKPDQKYWNYDSEELFQREANGAWGILHCMCCNPVNVETLECFRELYVPLAVTGYFDHTTKNWVVCEPTKKELSTETWYRSESYQNFITENPQYARRDYAMAA